MRFSSGTIHIWKTRSFSRLSCPVQRNALLRSCMCGGLCNALLLTCMCAGVGEGGAAECLPVQGLGRAGIGTAPPPFAVWLQCAQELAGGALSQPRLPSNQSSWFSSKVTVYVGDGQSIRGAAEHIAPGLWRGTLFLAGGQAVWRALLPAPGLRGVLCFVLIERAVWLQ